MAKKTTMNTTGGATVMGSYPFPRNGIIEIDYEFILLFKKSGKIPLPPKDIKEKSRIHKEKWKEYFSGHWYLNGAKQDKHIAMFPVELPKRLIEMFTFIGEVVLDPFLGSGTTSLAALITNRNSIGFEINKEFIPVIKEKLKIDDNTLFQRHEFIIKEQKLPETNWKNEIQKLKYIFKDPVKFDRKIDPNKLKFGSKININDAINGVKREAYYTVKEIMSPCLIKLSNDLMIRLMGIKVIPQKQLNAINFLKKKILKRQIFLKYDDNKYDDNNILLAYVYLKNRTFVNAHLIKYGFAKVDREINFKLKDKFLKLEQNNA